MIAADLTNALQRAYTKLKEQGRRSVAQGTMTCRYFQPAETDMDGNEIPELRCAVGHMIVKDHELWRCREGTSVEDALRFATDAVRKITGTDEGYQEQMWSSLNLQKPEHTGVRRCALAILTIAQFIHDKFKTSYWNEAYRALIEFVGKIAPTLNFPDYGDSFSHNGTTIRVTTTFFREPKGAVTRITELSINLERTTVTVTEQEI